MTIRLGVDTGGTFTDVVLFDEATESVYTTKTSSTPADFARGVLNGIDKILDETDTDSRTVEFLNHGTTVGTNAILEKDLPRLGLVTNEGLRDVLEIGDQTRPELYNLFIDKPPALVPRNRRKGVPGRIDSSGEELDPFDEEAASAAVDELVEEDVEGIVVSMMFSYLNSAHEEAVRDVVAEEYPELSVVLSSEIHPEIREYKRTITTVLNEAVKYSLQDYLRQLEGGISERGITPALNVMHSGGGIFGTDQATEKALRTVLSGPAAGGVGAKDISLREGYQNAIGIDMGGTSADVSMIRDGELLQTTEGTINDLPINIPMIDINTVGSGGGSIAWIDEGGALRVGPRSAGADPGPVCYGNGGEEPTVTDANLILGRIDPDNFLGGEMDPSVERAERVFEETIAAPLGQSLEEAALSVLAVANASLEREIRKVTVERGHDPTAFALVAFGGAGPLQAPFVADEMGISTTIVPNHPGVFSARGLLVADVEIDKSHSYTGDEMDVQRINEQFERLTANVTERIDEQGFEREEMDLDRTADIRYDGQSYELTVDVPDGPLDETTLSTVIENFHDEHESLYGHAMRDEDVELITLRVKGRVSVPSVREDVTRTTADRDLGTRSVYFEDVGHEETAIYERRNVSVAETVEGPAIVREPGSTSIVPPETTAELSKHGSLILESG